MLEAAEYLGVNVHWLYRYRHPTDKYYIPRTKMGRRVCFDIDELKKFTEKMTTKKKRQPKEIN